MVRQGQATFILKIVLIAVIVGLIIYIAYNPLIDMWNSLFGFAEQNVPDEFIE